MPQVRVNCPNCKQPVAANVEQLFDVNVDPSAKQRLLSGGFNLIQCQFCGYQGNLATPLVYHDPEKELLLTFVPPELGISREEQEKVIGDLINRVINNLPNEKRKGYLFSPQAALSVQGFVERILEADGVTREMIQEQQNRLNLIRRLANVTDEDVLKEIATQEDANIDAEFFALLRRLTEASLLSGDRESAEKLQELQKSLIPLTTYGKEWEKQSREVESAIQDLKALGKDITHEKILDLVINAPNDVRLSTYVSMVRPALDYVFFQLLSERIERASDEDRQHLEKLREKLLELTQEIDRVMQARREEIRQSIDQVVKAEDFQQALVQAIPNIDDLYLQELNSQYEEAQKQGDLERSAKLREFIETLEQLSSPPELALIEEYLEVGEDAARQKFLEEHEAEVDEKFLEMLANLAVQIQSGEDKEFADRVMQASRQALRFSMERNLRKP